ncbi:class I SAM-dependent methyltransferase [Roseibacterium sp. SDUM158017]|uniref:class I SAM-dependent methyltransferase n=1 Tax=Roseicyclus salinarum TaxID=3036773 RepID=UPI00241513C4|nr:class I SAM-dependent methyltransferase [Roseibacterium sp. SDUM158017]MDG4648497.1 class I SAM-dependent methyltransferase [Roseibacterium sp. SDUM158017]
MSGVEAQYEAYPYPERDPEDETKRLITGSPSHPLEIDHFLHAGRRDWTRPFRALVAGGGTGDALIQLAQVMASAGREAEIVYLDLSKASRRIAEARARARGLDNIAFHTGSLLDAAGHGRFDYIDCCGVLHHLSDPQAGFDALAAALAPGGGIGLMVYAPHGRSGVYPLQSAFGRLLKGPPEDRLKRARAIFGRLPEGHPFRRNPHLGDHETGDAGFYDLLLHSQDTPFTITALAEALERAGLVMTGTPNAHLYDPAPIVGDAADLDALSGLERMALAEELCGAIRLHVVYAARAGEAEARVARPAPGMVPHIRGVQARALAQAVAKSGRIPVTSAAGRSFIEAPKALAPIIARINGRRTLDEIARASGTDWFALAPRWTPLSERLSSFGLLNYSGLYRR